MSLLDDFEILDAKADKACKEDIMSLFLHKFISSNINIVYPKNQLYIGDFDVHLVDVKKCLNGKFESDASSSLCAWGDAVKADITWDLSEWLDKDHNNVYIGYNYMYFPTEDRRLLQFKLFNADEVIPNLNVEIEKDQSRYSPYEIYQPYVNERYKNTYRGYKILSVKSNQRSTAIGWLEFNMDLIMQLICTNWQYPYCDQIPSTYKVIPYGWDKKKMGEYVEKGKIDYIF